jgi:DNA (cytosine-5)-methyltransferase 1
MSIKVGSDFSGVGAFEQSLNRLGIKHEVVFACDKDKYARLTYVHNYGEPEYYPDDVYDREIPAESLDIYMTSPPCQSFSLAGKRLGKDDKRGILFFNSHEFIAKNKPRYFIFENVKGLLSDDGGKTFSEWLHLLGGKSVNGMPIVFPYDGAVPYHVYWKVLNAKDFGVPQNRERVFIIGIRDDVDNDFSFPKEVPLTKRLKDVLESEVNEKYYLSDKMIAGLINHTNNSKEKGSGFAFNPKTKEDVGNCITSRVFKMGVDDNYIQETPQLKQVGSLYGGKWDKINESARRYYDTDGISPTIHTCGGGNTEPKIEVDENWVVGGLQEHQTPRTDGICPALTSAMGMGGGQIPIILGEDTGNTNAVEFVPQSMTKKQLDKFNSIEVDENIAGCITHAIGRAGSSDEYISSIKRNAIITKRIRKLTPRECFRLMDFPDTFDFSVVSNSQAYKQAGNSIVVAVLAAIINKLKL